MVAKIVILFYSKDTVRKFTIYNRPVGPQFTIKFLFLIFTFYILHFTFYLTPAFAQSPVSTPSATLPTTTYSLPIYISPTSPLYTDMLLHNMFHTFSCLGIGQSIIGQPCLTYQVTKNAQGALQSIPMLSQIDSSGGLLGTTTSLIGALYDSRPLKTSDYIASIGQDLGIIKVANAQVVGSGAAVLSPILKLWQVSRNISYVIMILIFTVIGLMIIFRNKINPQTVITAQAALPGLVIGLILITFSYFLAALLADTAFLGTNIVGAYFSAAQAPDPNAPPVSSVNLSDNLKNGNVLSIMSAFIGTAGQGDLHNAVSNVLSQIGKGPGGVIGLATAFLSYQYAYQMGDLPATGVGASACGIAWSLGWLNPGSWITGAASTEALLLPNCIHNATLVAKTGIAAIAAGAALLDAATPISVALYFILIAVLLYTMFKLLMRLVTCFLTIILYTIIAPFQFMIAALPGRQGIATGWILSMLSNILAFPAVIAVFYFVNYLLGSGVVTPLPIPAGQAPQDLTGGNALPLLANLPSNFFRLILAFGTLLATPTIPDIVGRAISKASQAGQMIGGEIGGGFRSGQGYVGRAQQGVGSIQTGGLYNKKGYVAVQKDDGSIDVETTYDPRFGGQVGTLSKLGANRPQWLGGKPHTQFKP